MPRPTKQSPLPPTTKEYAAKLKEIHDASAAPALDHEDQTGKLEDLVNALWFIQEGMEEPNIGPRDAIE